MDAIDPQPGQVVLITGATGGVGSFAIQLAAARGATVLATGTAADAGRLKDLGATVVLDYTAAPVTDQVRAAYPDGIDALIDLVSYAPDDLPLSALRKGGKVASSLGAGANIMALPLSAVLTALAAQVLDGTLRVDVGTILPLDRAADGLATLADGKARGKIVVQIGS